MALRMRDPNALFDAASELESMADSVRQVMTSLRTKTDATAQQWVSVAAERYRDFIRHETDLALIAASDLQKAAGSLRQQAKQAQELLSAVSTAERLVREAIRTGLVEVPVVSLPVAGAVEWLEVAEHFHLHI